MAMPGWQLPGSGLVIAETPSGSGLMGAHAYSCDRGMGIPRQLAFTINSLWRHNPSEMGILSCDV